MGIKFGLWDGALDGDGPCAPAECVFKDVENSYESCVKCGGPKYEKPEPPKNKSIAKLTPHEVSLLYGTGGPKKEFTKQAAEAKAAKKFPVSLEQITPMLLTDEAKKAISEVVAKKFAEDTKVSSPENLSALLAKDGENLSKLLADMGNDFWKNLMEDATKKWKEEAFKSHGLQWISCKHEWEEVVTCVGMDKKQCKHCKILINPASVPALESCPGHVFSGLYSATDPSSPYYICGPCAVIVQVPKAVNLETGEEPITLVSKATEKMEMPMKGFGKDLEHFSQKILAGLQLPASAIAPPNVCSKSHNWGKKWDHPSGELVYVCTECGISNYTPPKAVTVAPSHGCSPATHDWQLKIKNIVSGGWNYRCKDCKKDANACPAGTHNWTKWNDTSNGPIYVCTTCGINNQAPMTEAVNTAPANHIKIGEIKIGEIEKPTKKKAKAALAVNPEKAEKIKKIMEASKVSPKKAKAGNWTKKELEEAAEEAMLPLGTNSPKKPIPGDNDFFNLAQIIAKASEMEETKALTKKKLAGSGNPNMYMGATMADLCAWENHIWKKQEDCGYVCTTCGSTHTTQDDIPGGKQACEHVEVWKGKMASGGTACLRCGITLQLSAMEIKKLYDGPLMEAFIKAKQADAAKVEQVEQTENYQNFPPNQLEQEPPTGYKYPVQEVSPAEVEKFEKEKQKNCNHAWVDAGTHRVFCNRCQLLHPVVGICREHFNPSTVSTILEMGERDLVIGALINRWREGMASWSDVLCKVVIYLGEALDLVGPHGTKNPLKDAPRRNLLLGKK